MPVRSTNQELVGLLDDKAGAVGCYLGSIRVLGDEENPSRVEMASYGMREMLDELEIAAGIAENKGAGLGERVRNLKDAWAGAKRGDDGALQAQQVKLTKKIDDFFDDFDRDFPRRRLRAGMTIRGLSPVSRSWPPAVESRMAERLVEVRKRLNKGLHRGDGLSVGELGELIDELEDFLLRLFRPPTFEDFSEIDAILEQGSLGN
jgi:hypothetical protein